MFKNKVTLLCVLEIWACQICNTNPLVLAWIEAMTLKCYSREFVSLKSQAKPSCHSLFYASTECKLYSDWLSTKEYLWMLFCIQVLGSWAESISQNHIAAEVGRHIWSSYSPRPCSKQGHLQQVAKGYVLLNFWYLQGWTLHIPRISLGNTFHLRISLKYKGIFLF